MVYMSKKFKIVFGVILIVLIISSPYFQFLKSVTIMSISSTYQRNYSLLKEENIKISMPGGISTIKKDWYPFVMTFNSSEGFSNYVGKDVKLSILYNFGAYDFNHRASTFYDRFSPYFNAFYGAYVVKGKGFPYGYFADGKPDYDEMALIAKYDMTQLVLNSLGCTHYTFDSQLEEGLSMDKLLGYEDWDVIEGTVLTNSPMHMKKDGLEAYIQYGKPPKNLFEGKDFPLVEMKGKFYARYFQENGCTIFFYAIASNSKVIEEWENDILLNTKLSVE
ncbi:MAG: hypothetical protein CVU84_05015 [Firmicutes bacterium HGW-Firmicutes-1]|nr:MAG: hypothetical protein CVU84_05015 [Firmicutes bacterium HGW-Firmicutes-1]